MKRPLTGKVAVVTRAGGQAGELIATLTDAGAKVIHFPTIEFTAPDSWQACDDAIDHLEEYDWLVFTSTNGVRFFLQRLEERGKGVVMLAAKRFAAVGERTMVELSESGIEVDLVPEAFHAEGLVRSFQPVNLRGKKVLIAKAQESREVLEHGLLAYGANVDAVAVYKTQLAQIENQVGQLTSKQIDLLTFTSPSTFKNFVALLGMNKLIAWKRNGCALAAIGGVTAEAIIKHGLSVDILAKKTTVADFMYAILEHFREPAITE